MGYKYLFGPVLSRRLGSSLGVDLVPHKVCTLDCIYCECGGTTRLTMKRREYIPITVVRTELDHFLTHQPHPDFITFSGYGEPTLHNGIGTVISHIRHHYPELKTAVITNATLFSNPEVRSELLCADLVLPSLDAVSEASFRAINRPHPGLSVDKQIQGIIDFRKEFSGEIWLEVLFLPGINDNPEHLSQLRETILLINPDRIQLNTLDRPGTINGLHPVKREFLSSLRKSWNLPGVEIIASATDRKDKKRSGNSKEDAILGTISRRPSTLEELNKGLGIASDETRTYLSSLEADGKIEAVRMERGIFYQIKKTDNS